MPHPVIRVYQMMNDVNGFRCDIIVNMSQNRIRRYAAVRRCCAGIPLSIDTIKLFFGFEIRSIELNSKINISLAKCMDGKAYKCYVVLI